MELFLFGRFHAQAGKEKALEEAMRVVLGASREEAGCLSIHIFRSTRDSRLFYLQSRWKDEEAFDAHATLPHTVRFLDQAETLIDHPLDTTRAELIA